MRTDLSIYSGSHASMIITTSTATRILRGVVKKIERTGRWLEIRFSDLWEDRHVPTEWFGTTERHPVDAVRSSLAITEHSVKEYPEEQQFFFSDLKNHRVNGKPGPVAIHLTVVAPRNTVAARASPPDTPEAKTVPVRGG